MCVAPRKGVHSRNASCIALWCSAGWAIVRSPGLAKLPLPPVNDNKNHRNSNSEIEAAQWTRAPRPHNNNNNDNMNVEKRTEGRVRGNTARDKEGMRRVREGMRSKRMQGAGKQWQGSHGRDGHGGTIAVRQRKGATTGLRGIRVQNGPIQ